jgi:hypothetical protein
MRRRENGSERQIVILAPESVAVPSAFHSVYPSSEHHAVFLAGLQRLRGEVYLRDGAIRPRELTSDGRHVQAADHAGWHILLVGADASVVGCVRFLRHEPDVTFQQLGVYRSALSRSEEWGPRLHLAVESEIARARQSGMSYVELGGWAIADGLRYSREARRTALTTYALTQLLGGSLCISTVTVRHNSAAMLRRIGGTGLEVDGVEIPRYYDPRYGCEMEILRFDSRHPGPKYQRPIEQVRGQLSMTPVICGLSQVERLRRAVAGLAVTAEREGGRVERAYEWAV